MKVLDQDRKDGYMRLRVESDDDLWHLKHVVEGGDTLRMDDQRTTLEGGEKKRCTLTLKVEKVDYQGNRLRATGEIVEAPEDVEHGYHTFNLAEGVEFAIWKEDWKEYQLDRVSEAADTEAYEILVCMIDKDGATFSRITETGIENVTGFESNVPGKMYKDASGGEDAFYKRVISVLEENTDADHLILAGPGFAKENLYNRLEEQHPAIADKVHLEGASTIGTAGVQEVIKRGAVQAVRKQSRVADEVETVEELLEHINKDDGKAVYGKEAVEEAVEMGAVETLLVNDALVHKLEDMMARVEERDGTVQIVHEDHDAGTKLSSLGGVAALLRYRIK